MTLITNSNNLSHFIKILKYDLLNANSNTIITLQYEIIF